MACAGPWLFRAHTGSQGWLGCTCHQVSASGVAVVYHASAPQENVGPAGSGWWGRDASAPEDFSSSPRPPSQALAGPSPGLAATLISQHAVHTLANRPKGQEASTG